MNESKHIRWRVLVAAALGASALIPFASPPAEAVTYTWEGINYGVKDPWNFSPGDCYWVDEPATSSGQFCFEADGDRFRVADTGSDGRRAGVEWKTSYGRWGMCVSKEGNTLSGERTCDFNFAEGRRIIFRGGLCDGTVHSCGKPVAGSGWSYWTAWREKTT